MLTPPSLLEGVADQALDSVSLLPPLRSSGSTAERSRTIKHSIDNSRTATLAENSSNNGEDGNNGGTATTKTSVANKKQTRD